MRLSRRSLARLWGGLSWFWVVAAVITGGVIHIATVLALPYLATDTAWTRLGGALAANRMQVLPPATPELQAFPFMAPDVRYAACRYDLSEGPVIVRADLLHPTWSIALYTPRGDNFYTVTSADLGRRTVKLRLEQAAEGPDEPLPLPRKARTLRDPGVRVTVPSAEGILLIRAPLLGDAYLREADNALSQASCAKAS